MTHLFSGGGGYIEGFLRHQDHQTSRGATCSARGRCLTSLSPIKPLFPTKSEDVPFRISTSPGGHVWGEKARPLMDLLIRTLGTEGLELVVHATSLPRVLGARLEGHRARQVLGNLTRAFSSDEKLGKLGRLEEGRRSYGEGERVRVRAQLGQELLLQLAQRRLALLRRGEDLDCPGKQVFPEGKAQHVQVLPTVAEGAAQGHEH